MLTARFSQFNWHQDIKRSLIVGTLATVGVLSGVHLEFSPTLPRVAFNLSAQAEDFTTSELRSFAEIVLFMEPFRQQAFADIGAILGDKPTTISCSEPATINKLPGKAREIAVGFCNQYRESIEENGLTPESFSEIKKNADEDPELTRRIQQEMIDLRQ